MNPIRIANWTALDEAEQRQLLQRPALVSNTDQPAQVADIIAAVRRDGDKALFELTARLDGVELQSLEVSPEEADAAAGLLSQAQRDAIGQAAANIERFHSLQRPSEIDIETMPGVRCQRVVRPLGRVGLYVPAGTAPLPSTALMLGVPAKLAGCPLRILCCPPDSTGGIDAAVLYAARLTGIERVFRIGGAQAIAAMAYGTESVPKVDKVFGPGNSWVTEAKTQADLDPEGAAKDYPAGPSEVLVIADADADPGFVASDLLSQAEHGTDSQSILITTSAAIADEVNNAVSEQLATLSRGQIAAAALQHAAIIVVDSLTTAIDIANRYAPEHLILQVANPRDWIDSVNTAGSVFLGAWTPESVGDYCSGTNHVLPTYGYASRFSSLGLNDFLRSMTVQELSPAGLQTIGPIATTLAETEGLDAHARAVSLRLKTLDGAGS